MGWSIRRRGSAVLFVLVLLTAFMPWLSVTCGGEQLNVTGRELVLGRLDDDPEMGIEAGPDEEREPEVFVILAFVAAAVGLVTVAGRGSGVARARVGVAMLGAAFVIAERVKVTRDLQREYGSTEFLQWEFGWWLALAAFVAIIPLQFARSGLGDPESTTWSPPRPRETPRGLPAPPSESFQGGAWDGDRRAEWKVGTVMIREDRGIAAALAGTGLVVLSMGLDWATFSRGLLLDFGPLAMGIAVVTAAVLVILDLARIPVPLTRANQLLGAGGVAVAAIVGTEVVRLLMDDRDLSWGVAPAVVGAVIWAAVGVARGWPEAVASLQSPTPTASSIRCPRCKAGVSGTARFCAACGYVLRAEAPDAPAPTLPTASGDEASEVPSATRAAPVCASCGATVTPGLRFCVACGTAVAPAS